MNLLHGNNVCTSNVAHSTKEKMTAKPSAPGSVTDPLRLLPSQFLPVYLLVFFQSHPIELQLDKAKCLCEQHFHQIFPTGPDGSGKELIKR